jgi:hypothetical protein
MLTVAGKLSDGTPFTTATYGGPHGEVLVYQALYGNLGSVLGTLGIIQGAADYVPAYGDNELEGAVSWLRPAMAGKNHVYRDGFGPIACSIQGGRYVPPTRPALLFGVTDDGETANANVLFDGGGIDGTSTDPLGTLTLPDVAVRIKASGVYVPPHQATVDPDPNPRSTTLAITTAKGLFSGSASLVDANPAVSETATVKRKLSYFGIIFRDSDTTMRGCGFFMLPRRPDMPEETPLTTDQLSGRVVLEKAE